MADKKRLSSGKKLTKNDICMLLIKDCKPKTKIPYEQYSKYMGPEVECEDEYEDEYYRKKLEAEKEEEIELLEIAEKEEAERHAYDEHLQDIHSNYGYGTYIEYGEDLDAAEERAKLDYDSLYW